MRDQDPWFIPYGYGVDDWVVFWCEKLFILLFKVVNNPFSQVMMNHQGWLCVMLCVHIQFV